MMKRAIILAFLLFAPGNVVAEEVVGHIKWHQLDVDESTAGFVRIPSERNPDQQVAKVVGRSDQGTRVLLTTNDKLAITQTAYAVTGEVKYENVAGDGFIEMMNYLSGNKRFFSRTLAANGPMQALKGSSDWRPFLLPFFSSQDRSAAPSAENLPTKLEFSVVMPAGGTIYLSNLKIVQYGPTENPLSSFQKTRATEAGHWWSEQEGGLYGGIYGALIGLCGAMVGYLTATGKAAGFVLGFLRLFIGFGLVQVIIGITAVTRSQPYHVYFPLLLGGIVVVFALGTNYKRIAQRYQEIELRKMEAMDSSG